jgi:hypothetical protein
MDKLEVPDDFWTKLDPIHAYCVSDDDVRHIATPVVAAELRRLADLWTDDWMVQSWLRKRAAALEAGQ